MTRQSLKPKTRGMPIVVPPWWLAEVHRLTAGKSLEEMAGELNELTHRDPGWDRSTIGKFLKNKFPTWELVNAFSALLDLPVPVIIARSQQEAARLEAESRRYDEDRDATAKMSERQERYATLQRLTDKMERDVEARIMRRPSSDGKVGRRPRRGVAGSGSSPS